MRRLSTLIILLSVTCMMAMAQIEISPRAQVMIKNSKTARSSQTQRAKSANSAEQRLTFVVKVAENNGYHPHDRHQRDFHLKCESQRHNI